MTTVRPLTGNFTVSLYPPPVSQCMYNWAVNPVQHRRNPNEFMVVASPRHMVSLCACTMILYCPVMMSHFLHSLGNYTRRAIFPEMCKINQSSVDFHCELLVDWLIDWRYVNFDLIGLLDSYRTICFYGGGAKVTQRDNTVLILNTCRKNPITTGCQWRTFIHFQIAWRD